MLINKLLARERLHTFASCAALLLITSAVAAQDADTLALPARKSNSEVAAKPAATSDKSGDRSSEKSESASREKLAVKRLSSAIYSSETKADRSSSKADVSEKPSSESTSKSDEASSGKSFGLLKKTASRAESASAKSASSEKPSKPSTTEKEYSAKSQKKTSSRASTSDSDDSSRKSTTTKKSEQSGSDSSERKTASSSKSSSGKESASSQKSSSDKKSSSESKSSSDEKRETAKKSSASSTDADLAALDNLRPGQSDSSTDESGMGSPSGEMSADADASADGAASLAPETFGVSAASDLTAPAAPEPSAMRAPATVPAANLYLPQTTPGKKGGLLSRLFGRRDRTEPGTAATAAVGPVPSFNSDYATRGSDDFCPVVLPGMGLNGMDIPIGSEDTYRLTSSLPANFRPTDLVLLPNQYCHYGNALYLRREAASALCQMIAAAAQEGYTLRIVSAYRDYNHQLRLYTRAVSRGGEDQQSVARPGRSEHFLGTTVDLTNDENHALERSFGDTPEGRWLGANAARFGWKMTVMSSNARRSHNDEPWHLRYLGSTINNPPGTSTIAQPNSRPQGRDVFGSIGRFLHLRR